MRRAEDRCRRHGLCHAGDQNSTSEFKRGRTLAKIFDLLKISVALKREKKTCAKQNPRVKKVSEPAVRKMFHQYESPTKTRRQN